MFAYIFIAALVAACLQLMFMDSGPMGLLFRSARRSNRMLEATLRHVLDCQWKGRTASVESLAGCLSIDSGEALETAGRLASEGLLSIDGRGIGLTEKGRLEAVEMVRKHRLLERYFAYGAGLDITDVHRRAQAGDSPAHAGSTEELEEFLGYPEVDPHGEPIPASDGELPAPRGRALSDCPLPGVFEIVRVEDEPDSLLRRIAALGLLPGVRLEALQGDGGTIRIRPVRGGTAGESKVDPLVASSVFVEPVPKDSTKARATGLDEVHPGQKAVIMGFEEALRGFPRRRLLDLGFTEGGLVECEYRATLGDPAAYRILGALIALRSEEASKILVMEQARNGNGSVTTSPSAPAPSGDRTDSNGKGGGR